ncbi:hypothetical protein F2Q69_00061818 [Brassica cretica]|uniref:Uncharacterized protein n=1 Tax=Brassica cretica TaxID=69181 RepID=A0A8S9RF20_BRACR|nr:hypothetical protein F2Q69_00061818 [Brassica cretica]
MENRGLDLVKARKMEKTSQDVQVHPNQMDARGNDKDACGTVRMVRRMRIHVCLRFLHHPSQVWHDPSQVWHDLSQVLHDPSQVWYGEKHEPRLRCSERPELHVELVPCNDPWTAAHQYESNILLFGFGSGHPGYPIFGADPERISDNKSQA